MRIVDNYNYLPGCCWICRGVAKPIIDMELDLDGHNNPDDANPSAITRLYICADCALELTRMVAPARSVETRRLGEYAAMERLAKEMGDRAEVAEERLALIAGAIVGVDSQPVEQAGPTSQLDEDDPQPGSARPDVVGSPLSSKRGRPRREDTPKPEIDTDFVGDL